MNILNSIKPYIPFLTPAVEKDRCSVDVQSLMKRMAVITAVVFAAIAATFTAAATLGLSSWIIAPCFGLFGFIFLDYWLSKKGVDQKALNEYMDLDHPSPSATEWLLDDESLLDPFIESDKDINKTDEAGHRLLDAAINPLNQKGEINFFKKLIDANADLTLKDNEGITYMERIFQSANPLYLEYVVEKEKIPPGLSNEQKFRCWLLCGHGVKTDKVLPFLMKNNFSYNMKSNSTQKTPLVQLIEMDPDLKSPNYSRGLSPEEHVLSLIHHSDDLQQTVTINGKSGTVREFLDYYKDREPIKDFFENLTKKPKVNKN